MAYSLRVPRASGPFWHCQGLGSPLLRRYGDGLSLARCLLESHMSHIFEKLGVATRSELPFLAYETGMVDPSHGRDTEAE